MGARNISFNGNNLQTANIITSNFDDSPPSRQVSIYGLAHANASKILHIEYPSRTIKLTGQIVGTSISNVDTLADTFKGYLNGIDKNLDVDYAGTTRRYIATLNAIKMTRPYGLNNLSFELEFICSQPFGQNVSTTTIKSATARTAASYSDAFTFIGTAPWQQPIATITYTAVSGATGQSVNFGNNTNGQQITVTRTWTAGDVLSINSLTKIVTVNGIEVDYTGAFPEFPPGAQSVGYSDGFTTRTFNYSVVYYPMYQ